MEQKFIKLEEAVDRLGISSERLNQLREQGEIRAYRDGSSWKFRTDEIEKLVAEGVPEASPPSDIGLVVDDDLVAAEPLETADLDEGDELTLAEGELDLDESGQDEKDQLNAGSDSILLSEEQLGESATGSASTIIGKSELEDADLEMASEDSAKAGVGSDVRLARDGNASHVLSSAESDSDDVLEGDENESRAIGAFEDLDELEIDLAVESSRILNPEDVAQAQAAAQQGKSQQGKSQRGNSQRGSAAQSKEAQGKVDSDLQLDDLELAVSDSGTGAGEAADSDIELSSSDSDFVLADAGGSDLSLDSADSGINLVDPSDSGLALDDIPLEMGGSAILDSLSLSGEGSDAELSLVGGDSNTTAGDSFAELQTDDDFQLTPMGEGEADADDSSSQVIALDEGLEDLGDAVLVEEGAGLDEGGLGAVELGDEDLLEDSGEAMVLTEEDDVELQPVSTSTVASAEDYTMGNILLMGSCVLLLMIGSSMMIDMIRSIWSWDQPYALNSTILEGLMGIFKLN